MSLNGLDRSRYRAYIRDIKRQGNNCDIQIPISIIPRTCSTILREKIELLEKEMSMKLWKFEFSKLDDLPAVAE